METRAHFVLIGLFTILGFVAMLGFVLWLAKVQIDRTYAQYDILLETAAGLSQTAAVRYNGVDVGHVHFDDHRHAGLEIGGIALQVHQHVEHVTAHLEDTR